MTKDALLVCKDSLRYGSQSPDSPSSNEHKVQSKREAPILFSSVY